MSRIADRAAARVAGLCPAALSFTRDQRSIKTPTKEVKHVLPLEKRVLARGTKLSIASAAHETIGNGRLVTSEVTKVPKLAGAPCGAP